MSKRARRAFLKSIEATVANWFGVSGKDQLCARQRNCMEPLERRQLLAAAYLSDGVAVFDGDDVGEFIGLTLYNNLIYYTIAGTRIGTGFPTTQTQYRINANGGDDNFHWDSIHPVTTSAASFTIYGGAGSDMLDGGSGADTIYGGDGNDYLISWGTGGADRLYGEAGNDFIGGGDGSEILDGGAGTDQLDYSGGALGMNLEINIAAGTTIGRVGGVVLQTDTFTGFEVYMGNQGGDDSITGSAASEVLYGQAGNDTIDGGAGDDWISGHTGNDYLVGGDGSDIFMAGAGNDTLVGGAGDDSYWFDDLTAPASYLIVEASSGGTDTMDFSLVTDSAVTVNLAVNTGMANYGNVSMTGDATANTAASIERIIGGAKADNITGNSSANYIDGWEGNDTLYGVDGSDTIYGGNGDDLIYGQGKADTLYGGWGNDTIVGGAGNDYISGDYGDDTLDGRDLLSFLDTIVGGDGTDSYWCDANDVLQTVEIRLV